MTVKEKKYENDEWEYRLQNADGIIYGNDPGGSWVGEGNLKDAG